MRMPTITEPVASPQSKPASDDGAVELTVVMPCLNEAETLETCIRKASECFARHGIRGEIVIGDNGSTDGSQEIARKAGARVVDVPVKGYGMALHYATLAAHGRYVIMGDSDDSYDFSALMPFLEKLREGYDLVMGNRFKGGIKPGAMPWKNRYIGNPILSFIGRMFFRCPAGDFHCGLRGFSVDAYRRMGLRTSGMEFASEMVIKATLLDMKIAEVPTTLSPDGRSRPPHLRPWRDGWRHLRFMLLFSPRWLFLYPGILLMLFGLVVGAWLLPGPRQIGSVVFDVQTLLYAALAVLLGFQMLALALFTNVFATREGLLPRSKRLKSILRFVRMEVGLALGGIMWVTGLVGTVAALGEWGVHKFGPLDTSHSLRLVIPSFLAMALGSEIILASFFLGVLVNLPTRREEAR
jgi:glycosyltransferase involved in cell wall biosynthesis